MTVTITITLADDSHTAVEHAINHARAIEREFERVGCPALFEVHTGSLADESVLCVIWPTHARVWAG